jgi:hypothetical protein
LYFESPLPSYFNSYYYRGRENDKSLEVELAEIENEFQNNCSKYTLSKHQILNEKSLLSNNLKPYVRVYLKDENAHLNVNHEDEIYTYYFQNSNLDVFYQSNNDDTFLKETFSTFEILNNDFDQFRFNHNFENFQLDF